MSLQAHILVAEDDLTVARHLVHLLLNLGHDPVQAHNGASLKLAVTESAPDVIFLDGYLGDSHGTEIIEWLGTSGFGGVVIPMSGAPDSVELMQAVAQRRGVRCLTPLNKPFRTRDVQDRLDLLPEFSRP